MRSTKNSMLVVTVPESFVKMSSVDSFLWIQDNYLISTSDFIQLLTFKQVYPIYGNFFLLSLGKSYLSRRIIVALVQTIVK